MKYVAKEGYVYDWKDLTKHTHKDEETGEIIQNHLYAKELYLSPWDSIDNYIEVKKENIV